MVDIKHCLNRITQGNKPICGICAFFNGFYDGKIRKLHKWNDLVNKLWIYSIDTNIINNISLLSADDVLQYSFMGEFFSSNNLENFLAYISQYNINVRAKNINVKHELSKLINRTITKIDIDDVEKIDWDKFLDKEETTFYLIPVNSWIKCNDKYNMHWICLKQINGKPYILNSAYNRLGERNAIKHAIKDNNRPINKWYKCVGISNSYILDNVVTNMQNRSKYVSFDFKEWVKNCKSQKFVVECKKRIDKINKSQACEYIFGNSEFKIIKVTYY